jgi:hypothetical protein
LISDSIEESLSTAQTATATIEPTNSALLRVDFTHPELCTDCNPVTCAVNGEAIPVGTWRDLLVNLVEMFIANGNQKISELTHKPLMPGSGRPFLLKDKPNGATKQISTDQWIYINYNIADLVDIIGKLCRYCDINLNDVWIIYTHKKGEGAAKRNIVQNYTDSSVFAQPEVREAFRAWLVEQYPDWSSSTVSVHYSDAYYMYNNDCGVTLAEALTTYNGLQRAYDAIERQFAANPTRINNPAGSARGYLRSLHMLKEFLAEKYPALLHSSDSSRVTVPRSVIAVLSEDYAAGFRFDATALRLLSNKANVEIDKNMQSTLKQQMFRRNDDVYFLLDVVADAETRKDITDFADALLDEYGCFEMSELYTLYADRLNPQCTRDADDFEKFYEYIGNHNVRCVVAPRIGNRIARYNNGNVWGTFDTIAQRIIAVTTDEFDGVISEEDLQKKFRAFSADLLAKIIRNCIGDELLRCEINGIVCYRTLDAIGLPDDFSDTLSDILYRLDALGLTPSEEVLHTALSLALGVNFKAEYNMPDQATYRRIIDVYYKTDPPREWKSGVFGEVAS